MIKYRTEMSASSERKAIPVMLFEITELHNTDILDYVMNHYHLPGILMQNIQEYIDNIDDIEEGDENVAYMLKEILGCIEDETGVNVRYALWLADKDAVEELYDGDELDVYPYETDNAIILSDLGYDGTLYGFEEMPEPLDDDEDDEIEESTKLSYQQKRALYESVMREISRNIKMQLFGRQS